MRALARHTYLRAGIVLGVAAVVFLLAGALATQVFDRVDPFDISDPESEVVQASEAYEAATGRAAVPGVVLLIEAGSTDPEATARELRSIRGIAKVDSPGSEPLLESTGNSLVIGYLSAGVEPVDVGEAVEDEFDSTPGVLPGGTAVAAHQVGLMSEQDTRRIELYATPVLVLLLLLVFRTLTGALLPLVVAGLSILLTFATLRLLTDVTSIDLFALQTVTGLGVGLAIDYSLFILARYREEIRGGDSFEQAHRKTMHTAGRTVAFSSLTVAAALAALTVFPQPFLQSTGIAGALTAIFAGLTALLVLPAILALLGSSVERFAIRSDPSSRPSGSGGFWEWLPRRVCRRPVLSLLVGAVTMLALASQVIGIELTTPDAQELPADASSRQVADSIEDFPAIAPTRLFAVLPGSDPESSEESLAELAAVDGVTDVSPAMPLGADSLQLFVSASPDPLSEEGENVVTEVRELLPEGSLVGGRAAEQADQRSSILDHALVVIGIVVITNLLLLAAMTRSLLLPLLALAVNLLTVAASLGALTAAFTTSWITDLLGSEVQTGIDMAVPVIAFAVGFGLSTDYGIFLFERIREKRRDAASEEDAIIEAVSATGRLISASAALLAVAVGAFVFSDLVIVKQFAVAIAVAVLLDATLVRGLLIPASLKLLGKRAWWPGDRRAATSRRVD